MRFKTVPVWTPGPDSGRRTREFQACIEKKYGVKFDDYFGLHKWSVDNLPDFWAEVWECSGIICSRTYDQVIDLSIPMENSPKWFEGAKLNYAENVLRYRDDHLAIIATGETGNVEKITFKQLYNEVCSYAAAFKKLGLQKGEPVACYMSNRKEAVFAGLAVSSIGAVFTGGLPLLGPQAYLNRVRQTSPKFLITVDKFPHDKETKHLLKNIKHIADGLPSLEKVIIVPSESSLSYDDIRSIPKSCLLEDFLRQGREADGSVPEMSFEQVSLAHPVFVNYTSGTTGLPKTVVHGAGILLSFFRDLWIHKNSERGDNWLSFSPVGWASWNIFHGVLFLGQTVTLFEGLPFLLSPTFAWDLVDELQMTRMFIPPSMMDEMEKRGYLPTPKHHLSSLKAINCGSTVVKPHHFDLVLKQLRDGLLVSLMYACTESMASLTTLEETLPIYSGEMSCPSLGVGLEVVDDAGKSVLGEMGEILLTTPLPSMPLGLWNDEDGKLFKEAYFSQHKGKFRLGDMAVINPVTKGIIVCGRSDEIIKAKGCRFGSSEIYNVVELFPEISDSLCTSQYTRARDDERAVLFVKMKEDQRFTQGLVERIRRRIAEELTPSHVPEVIVEAPEIPETFVLVKILKYGSCRINVNVHQD